TLTEAMPVVTGQVTAVIKVSDGSKVTTVGSMIKIDSEQMAVAKIVGNSVTVNRPWNGTVSTTHAVGTLVEVRPPQGVFTMNGAYTWYKDIEFTNSDSATRTSLQTTGDMSHPWDINRGNVDVYGP